MNVIKNVISGLFKSKTEYTNYETQRHILQSKYLERDILLDVFVPRMHKQDRKYYPTLYFNDGQDMTALQMREQLNTITSEGGIEEIIVVAIHTNEKRMDEYGVTGFADYKERGNKAGSYSLFVTNELIPFVRNAYSVKRNAESTVFAGCSLGGLSAFDIVWNNEEFFSKVGVFSGSFWWRDAPFTEDDPDGGRILHKVIANAKKKNGLQFWLQVGTNDEASDRNNNGIIDAIDDTRDLISELKNIGYKDSDIQYIEVVDGEHNPKTWSEVLPQFLKWAFK
jgi:enterochelin esterase-like enzyme